ncbi:MAG: hypothetical protein Q8O22_02045, partial [Candidatus Omnitrophota bacterium]|nr:hypothetical protein [Candidatus Omnitrophota bacterium]
KKGSFLKCLRSARRAGIENINVDLMAGLPGQSRAGFVSTLNEVLKMLPEMIHVHAFYPTSRTAFTAAGGKIDRRLARNREMFPRIAGAVLSRRGYRPIKFDAWGKNDSARNIQLSDAIEHNSPFLGAGLGAASHATGHFRYANRVDINSYMGALKKNKLPVFSCCRVTKKQEMIYFCTSSLRYGSIDKSAFYGLFREDLNKVFRQELAALVSKGLIKDDPLFIYSRMNDMADYTLYSKYFFEPRLLRKFRMEHYRDNSRLRDNNGGFFYF